jgi:hypothetical protein
LAVKFGRAIVREKAMANLDLGLKKRLFGKVDQVSGVGYVATEFFHISYIPVFPFQSWVILEGSEKDVLFYQSWRGIPIPRSWKSIAFAWLRAPLLVCGFGGVLFAWLQFVHKPRENEIPFTLLELLVWCGVSSTLIGAFALTYWFSRANPHRAKTLALLIEEAERAAVGVPSLSAPASNTTHGQAFASPVPAARASSPQRPYESWADVIVHRLGNSLGVGLPFR